MSEWSEGSIETNGVTLHYYRTGGEKPPLVLSHGITDNGLCWTRAALVLQEQYDVIMVDARGHGQSDKPASEYSSAIHATDLAGLIQALELDAPRVMGHSMGAGTATALAATYPELVSRVVLEDPPWRADADFVADRAAGMQEWKNRIAQEQNLSQDEVAALGREQSPTWDEIEFGPWSLAKKQVSLNVFTYRLDSTASWRDALSQIACPTLLVTGDPEQGGIVTAETASEAAALSNHIQVANIPGVGHNIRRENFDRFIRIVQDFLQH
ncbi:MAG: alpha/beta hydrolase [Chloroflexota bacterium]